MGNVTIIGIDLAKNVFSLHGVDANDSSVTAINVQHRSDRRSPTLLNCSSGKRRLTIEERACGLHPGPSTHTLNKDGLETCSLSFVARRRRAED